MLKNLFIGVVSFFVLASAYAQAQYRVGESVLIGGNIATVLEIDSSNVAKLRFQSIDSTENGEVSTASSDHTLANLNITNAPKLLDATDAIVPGISVGDSILCGQLSATVLKGFSDGQAFVKFDSLLYNNLLISLADQNCIKY